MPDQKKRDNTVANKGRKALQESLAGNTTTHRSQGSRRESQTGETAIDSLDKELPEDVMVILVKNHQKRDESIRMRKENARKILKEKQQRA